MSGIVGQLEGVAVIAVIGFLGYEWFFGDGLMTDFRKTLLGNKGYMEQGADMMFGEEGTKNIEKGIGKGVNTVGQGIGQLGKGISDLVGGNLGDNSQTAGHLRAYADAGDVRTLAAANAYATDSANKAMEMAIRVADKKDAETLTKANEHADKGIKAATEKIDEKLEVVDTQINTNTHMIDSLELNLDTIKSANFLSEDMFVDTDRYQQMMKAHPERREDQGKWQGLSAQYDMCHTGHNSIVGKISARDRITSCLTTQAWMDQGSHHDLSDQQYKQIAHIADAAVDAGGHWLHQGVNDFDEAAQEAATHRMADIHRIMGVLHSHDPDIQNKPEALKDALRLRRLMPQGYTDDLFNVKGVHKRLEQLHVHS